MDPVDASQYLNEIIAFGWFRRVYAQGIFTTPRHLQMGSKGYNDIYIKNSCSSRIKADDLLIAINTAICQKNIIAIAKLNKSGSIKLYPYGEQVVLADDEVLIGPYSQNNRRRSVFCRTYTLDVTCSAYETLRQALHSHGESIFLFEFFFFQTNFIRFINN